MLPTFPLHADRDFRIGENTNTDTKYSVQIDDGALATPSSSHVEYSQVWFESVLRNCAVNKSTLHIDKPGRHTLRTASATRASSCKRSSSTSGA